MFKIEEKGPREWDEAMYKIGVVGPKPSVERIVSLAREYEQEMSFIPYLYEKTHETERIVRDYHQQVDAWFFSGPIPYLIAKKTLGSDEKMVYSSHTGSSLYKCFLQMVHYQGKLLEKISVDMLETENFEEALQDLELPFREIHVKNFPVEIDPEELLAFHLELWKAQKTEVAITCFYSIYAALQEAGVPAYWITPTRTASRRTLSMLAEKIKTSYFKDTQIGVEIIELESTGPDDEKAGGSYREQFQALRQKELLLKLAVTLNGSLAEKGNGRYVIYSSRGAIEGEVASLQQTMEQLSREGAGHVSVGIGFGQTVFAAEHNAYQAIAHSKEKQGRGIIIVQEDGTMIESAGESLEITYAYRTDDKAFLEKLKQSNINIKTYTKLCALIRKMGLKQFSPKEVSTYLHMSERNARRIVMDLCRVGLAECIGEESTRGRPVKIYRLQ